MACLARFLDRFGPVPVLLHDLGPMDQASPSVGDKIGLRLAPGAQRGRPFMGALDVRISWQTSITLQ